MSPWLDELRGQPQPGWWLPVIRLVCLGTAGLLQLPVFNRKPFKKFAGFVALLAELPFLSSPPGSQGRSSQLLSTLLPSPGSPCTCPGEACGDKPCLCLCWVHLPAVHLHMASRGESLFPALARLSWQLIFAGVPPESKIGCSCTSRVQLCRQPAAVPVVYGCAGGVCARGVWLCQCFGCPEEKRRKGKAIP